MAGPAGGSANSNAPRYMHLPIRVTESSLEPLFYCLAQSIEFQRSLNGTVKPVEVSSEALGGVTYPVCANHADSLIRALPVAVAKAKSLPHNCGSGELAGALFVFRVKVIKQSTVFRLGFLPSRTQVTIEEWEFVVLKLQSDTFARMKAPPGSPTPTGTSSSGHSSNPGRATPSVERLATPLGGDTSYSAVNLTDAPAAGGPSPTQLSSTFTPPPAAIDDTQQLVFSNDSRQIRDVLTFIINKSFEAIDTYMVMDFANAAELLFELTVEEKTAF
jgi:hypothetical protein